MKNILAAVLLVVATSANAEWSKQYDMAYVMGDGDTRMSARQAAIEQIRLKASNEAGVYVQSETSLNGAGELTESIRMIGAAMVLVDVKIEKLSLSKEGAATLNITAVATLDDKELEQRIRTLQSDRAKAEQISILMKESFSLRQELIQISESLKSGEGRANAPSLLSRQADTLRMLESNSSSITQVFAKGTLLQLATMDEQDFNLATRQLDNLFYTPILLTPIHAEISGVTKTESGYVAKVLVGWNLNKEVVEAELAKYFASEYEARNNQVIVQPYNNSEDNAKKQYSPKLLRKSYEQKIVVQVDVGGTSVDIPVVYPGKRGFMSDDSCSEIAKHVSSFDKLNLCIKLRPNGNEHLAKVDIPLTRSQVERTTSVDAKMEVRLVSVESKRLALK